MVCCHRGGRIEGDVTAPRRWQDLIAGLALLALGLLVLQLNAPFAVGTLRAMGPGYLPRVLALLLLGIGLAILIGAFLGARERLEDWRPRGAIVLTLATLAFALLLERAGLVVATIACVAIAALAGRDARPLETALFAAAAALFAVLVFVKGLGQVMPVLPPSWIS
jgi:putative tricarboxylic transport membrane protein